MEELQKIKLQKINEGSIKDTFIGVISFSVLEKIVKLTLRKISGGGKYSYYQRPEQQNKIIEIVKFLEGNLLDKNGALKKTNDIISLFPTSMLLSFDSNDEECVNKFISIKNSNNGIELVISKDIENVADNDKPVLIVDGQHRFRGVKAFYDKHPDLLNVIDIQFPMTILAGYDIYEQAEVFANVNFKQKKVDKSLYYDIFGTDPNKKNDITFSHFLVTHLNTDNNSPLKGMIKMLSNYEGVISQSALVFEFLKLLDIKKQKVFSKNFEDYKINNIGEKKVLESSKVYFKVIKEVFSEYWPDINNLSGYKGVLMKTTGARAFVKLMNYVLQDLVDLDPATKEDKIRKIFDKITQKEKQDIFDPNNGEFSGTGGLQNKLFHRLSKILGYEE